MEIREQLESILNGIPTSKKPLDRIVFYDNFRRLYGYDLNEREGKEEKGKPLILGRPDITGLDEDEIPF
ncbi:hypothetical protein C7H19_23870 [Aphanothece hegewaldii CCALA 016]|uniref:Uncharacterized protein n=1 Tax=Aphanothece hegewaldii CCALA 016 TaxID=2107694 RepID=A0A2T1LR39_9CHRO|nr:hypothetical protein [Aphanothece hegewaldii]PSF30439.1 hypothetical protein C7H19_23870 [Aphanothece hegewaldii CCALA 016]